MDRLENTVSGDEEFKKLFTPDGPTWVNQEGNRCLVRWSDHRRLDKAREQAALKPVSFMTVVDYVNEFFDIVAGKTRSVEDEIILDGVPCQITGRTIISSGVNWVYKGWNKDLCRVGNYDKKYDVIKDKFNSGVAWNLLWIKFTSDGHVGVVASSFDINYRYDYSCGKILREVIPDATWSDDILIIPLTSDVISNPWNRQRRLQLETGLGNYLISKGVPIIDYYSHNNF